MEQDGYNISVLVVDNSEDENKFWDVALKKVYVIGVTFAILGLVGNFLCFFTADYMDKSNFRVFMKGLAVWDSLSALCYGVVNMGFRLVGFDPTANKRYVSTYKLEFLKEFK